MTPLERAARALAKADHAPIWHDDAWIDYIDQARAVIAAIREPSESMLEAAAPYPDHLLCGRGASVERQFRAATAAEQETRADDWRSMIDALLAEEVK